MNIFEPSYYSVFRCIASACPDSCCKEWDVQVDPKSAARYRALSGTLGNHLRSVLVEQDGETVMLQTNGRCPMWGEDGLCKIQAALGEEALCQVCANFPRIRHDYGDFTELGLELSCPEAARLIFETKPEPHIRRSVCGNPLPEYDTQLMATLRRTRQKVLDLIENYQYSVNQLLAILLIYGYTVQEEIDGGEEAVLAPDSMLNTADSLQQKGNFQEILSFFSGLEILTEDWKLRLSSPVTETAWSDKLRPLVRYFVERYWLQAVSDYDIICRVKYIILSCLMIKTLSGDLIQTAQQYSKEIENDADNVEAILDGVYTSPALTDVKLLGYLLAE